MRVPVFLFAFQFSRGVTCIRDSSHGFSLEPAATLIGIPVKTTKIVATSCSVSCIHRAKASV